MAAANKVFDDFMIKLLGFSLKMGLLDAFLVTGVLPKGEFCSELYQGQLLDLRYLCHIQSSTSDFG